MPRRRSKAPDVRLRPRWQPLGRFASSRPSYFLLLFKRVIELIYRCERRRNGLDVLRCIDRECRLRLVRARV